MIVHLLTSFCRTNTLFHWRPGEACNQHGQCRRCSSCCGSRWRKHVFIWRRHVSCKLHHHCTQHYSGKFVNCAHLQRKYSILRNLPRRTQNLLRKYEICVRPLQGKFQYGKYYTKLQQLIKLRKASFTSFHDFFILFAARR